MCRTERIIVAMGMFPKHTLWHISSSGSRLMAVAIVLSTRGCSPWRPDAVIGTTGRMSQHCLARKYSAKKHCYQKGHMQIHLQIDSIGTIPATMWEFYCTCAVHGNTQAVVWETDIRRSVCDRIGKQRVSPKWIVVSQLYKILCARNRPQWKLYLI